MALTVTVMVPQASVCVTYGPGTLFVCVAVTVFVVGVTM